MNVLDFVLSFLLIFVIIIYFSGEKINEKRDLINSYCVENGFDGYYFDGEYKCYKDVVHESGVGTTKVYSGNVEKLAKEEEEE